MTEPSHSADPPVTGVTTETATIGARWALVASAAVTWFLVAALEIVLAPAAAALRGAAAGQVEHPLRILLALLPILVIAAPGAPLSALWGRERLALHGGAASLVAGVVMALVPGAWTLAPAAVVVIGGGFFLASTIGLVNRRATAAGVAGAFVLRALTLATSTTHVPANGAISIPVAAAVLAGAAGAAALAAWWRAPGEERGGSFERRAGGLRLRGALAFGALLHLLLTERTLAPASPPEAALALSVGAVAWLLVVRGFEVERHRVLAMTLAAVASVTALVAVMRDTLAAELLVSAIGHAAALLLLERALAPVSGRRSGANLASGLLLFTLLTLGAAVAPALVQRSGALHPGIWPALAGLVLIVAMYLTPRPSPAPAVLSARTAIAVAVAFPVLAFVLRSALM